MKLKLLLGLGITLLAMGCTSETELQPKDISKITRIYVGTEDVVDSRTVTNATTNAVTWAEGDEIAVFHVNGSGRSDYKHFRVVSGGAGGISAYFEAVSEADALTGGETYKLVYPYAAAGSYSGGSSNRYSLAVYELANSVDNLKTYDWLYSDGKAIPQDGTLPRFTMKHCFALVKVHLEVAGAIEGEDYDEYIRNFTLSSANSAFAQRVYWDENLDFAIKSYGTSAVSYNTDTWLENGAYTFWLPVYQSPDFGSHQLTLAIYMSHGTQGNTLWGGNVNYTPHSVLTAGYLYSVNLLFTVDGTNRTGTLTLVN